MRRLWLNILIGVVAVAAVALAGWGLGMQAAQAQNETPVVTDVQPKGIWVTGEGKVTVVPDIAVLRLGIEAQDTSVATAQTRAADAMNAVIQALKDNGVADNDIQTQHFSIQRVTRWDDKEQREVVLGYRVTNVVSAKIRTLDKVGTTIDSVAVAGGDLTRVDGISFSVDNPSTYQTQARDKAMADANAKAVQLASKAGVTLGKATYISESFSVPPPIYPIRVGEAVAAPTPATPISPGELEITLNVQVAYEIR